MKPFIEATTRSTFSILRDILLVVIGFNSLIVLVIVQPSGGTNALVGTIAVGLMVIGAYRTAREIIWRP